MATSTATFSIPSMTCGGCASRVTGALSELASVSADVNLDHKTVQVSFDPETTNFDTIAQQITDAGYPATPLN